MSDISMAESKANARGTLLQEIWEEVKEHSRGGCAYGRENRQKIEFAMEIAKTTRNQLWALMLLSVSILVSVGTLILRGH